jgi:hypothetical protein
MIKTLKIIAQVIVIIALIIGIYFGVRWIKGIQKDRVTSDEIYRKTLEKQVASVVRSELNALYPQVHKMIDSFGIKVKKVENVTIISHEYKYDTIPVQLVADTGMKRINISMSKDCFKADGVIDLTNTRISLQPDDVPKMSMFLTGVQLLDTTTNIYYFKRKPVKLFFFRLYIGRKQYFTETTSTCHATTKTESINLIKR